MTISTKEALYPNTDYLDAKTKNAVESISASFASVLEQNTASPSETAGVQNDEGARVEQASAPEMDSNDAYDRYRYRDNDVEHADNVSADTVSEESKDLTLPEEVAGFSDDVVEQIAQQLAIPKEEVVAALEEMDLSALDLLDPQKLAQVVVQLEGLSDSSEVLLSSEFQSLMTEIASAGQQLARELGMKPEELEAHAQEWKQLEKLPEPLEAETVATGDDSLQGGLQNAQAMADAATEAGLESEKGPVTETDAKAVSEEPKVTVLDKRTAEAETKQDNGGFSSEESFGQSDFSSQKRPNGPDNTQTAFRSETPTVPENTVIPESTFVPETPVVSEVPESTASYSAVDTLNLIEQIAEQAKITLATDSTSIEMQLNPENLGRIYLNVSEKEGVVHAQLIAQNDAVREALETSLATLRENLNQAGVKVDAIEVTVSSHAFERNLEQGAESDARQGENQEQQVQGRRRNLRMDALDELSGLMTKEEQLVAQIMRENGNSVDFTA